MLEKADSFTLQCVVIQQRAAHILSAAECHIFTLMLEMENK